MSGFFSKLICSYFKSLFTTGHRHSKLAETSSKDCIDVNFLCDGENNCFDGSDEFSSNCDEKGGLEVRLLDPYTADTSAEGVARGRVEIKLNVRHPPFNSLFSN